MIWRKTTLGSCCEIVSGATPSTAESGHWDGKIDWATPRDLSNLDGKFIERTPRRITEEGLKSCSATLLPPRSVLFSSRAPIGHVAINTVPMATNQGFKSFVPKADEVDPDFLYHWLRAKRSYLEGLGNGATFKEVSKAVVSRVEIALPPVGEQRRIAFILDKASAIRRKRNEAVALTEAFLRSAFLEMFGDPVTNPRRLERRNLGSLIEVKSGDFLPAKAMGIGGQFAVYGGNGVNGRHTEFMFEEPQIVIGRVGVYCGAVHRTEPRSWVTDNALYVAQMDRALTPSYLEHALRFADLNQYAGQSAQPLISGGRIYPVEILVPPLDEQRRFGNAERMQQRLRLHAREGLAAGNALLDALVHSAFRGELTMNGGSGMQLELSDARDR